MANSIRKAISAMAMAAILIVSCLASVSMGKQSTVVDDPYALIKQRLIEDGANHQQVRSIYQQRPPMLLTTIAKTFHIRESKLNYDQFLEPQSIAKAKDFLLKYESTLAAAESAYGVDRCLIASILLIETRFGSYTGQTPTLAVFSTFALMDNEKYRNKVWAMLSPDDKVKWGRAEFDRKLLARAQWAYQELRALFQLADSQSAKVRDFHGSVMGAVGWPQFLPSSQVRYGVDGNKDGMVDLFDPEDAIFSVANYFRGYGWCEAKSLAQKENVVYQYNHSRPYVNAVLGVASRLRELSGKEPF